MLKWLIQGVGSKAEAENAQFKFGLQALSSNSLIPRSAPRSELEVTDLNIFWGLESKA